MTDTICDTASGLVGRATNWTIRNVPPSIRYTCTPMVKAAAASESRRDRVAAMKQTSRALSRIGNDSASVGFLIPGSAGTATEPTSSSASAGSGQRRNRPADRAMTAANGRITHQSMARS